MFLGKVPMQWMLAEVADAALPEGGIASLISMLFPLILMGLMVYFMMIRPQKKKDKTVKQMREAIKVGDRVTTIGGIHGTVAQIKDENLVVAVGQDKVKLVFARWAISSVDEVSIADDAETLI